MQQKPGSSLDVTGALRTAKSLKRHLHETRVKVDLTVSGGWDPGGGVAAKPPCVFTITGNSEAAKGLIKLLEDGGCGCASTMNPDETQCTCPDKD